MSLVLALGIGVLQLQPRSPAPAPLPLTQLDERGLAPDLDNRTFSLSFSQPTAVKDLLLLLVRGTNISIVPDPDISGSFTGELKNVTVRQALGLILRPRGLDFAVDAGVVRVFKREPETRIYDLNYIAAERTAASTIGTQTDASQSSVSTTAHSDVFGDLANGVRMLLSERAVFNVDRKAGLLQVTDFPERLDRVGIYLDTVQDRVHRQVQLDARLVEVELSDDKAPGIDWAAVASQLAGAEDTAARAAPRRSLTGLRVVDVQKLLDLLAMQGKVAIVASPRVLTLNNEPAVVRTEQATFSLTPQIAGDSTITLSLSPILKAAAAVESDLLARVADGETLVVSGFTRDRELRERKNVGVSGGWFGRGTVVTRRRIELVILLTPKIVSAATAQ